MEIINFNSEILNRRSAGSRHRYNYRQSRAESRLPMNYKQGKIFSLRVSSNMINLFLQILKA